MRKFFLLGVFLGAWLLVPFASFAKENKVLTTIRPVHSLVSGIMKGVAEPHLLFENPNISPHSQNLSYSQVKKLEDSKLLFWIGEGIESAIAPKIRALKPSKTRVVRLVEVKNMKTLSYNRALEEGHEEEEHEGHHEEGHHEDGHHEEDDHKAHAHHKDHEHKDHGHKDHGHKDHGHMHDHDKHHEDDHEDDHKDHAHDSHAHHDHSSGIDWHIWLGFSQTKAMVEAMVSELVRYDEAHAAQYKKNGKELLEKLHAMEERLEKKFAQLKPKSYIVLHNAYAYFEKPYGFEPKLVLYDSHHEPIRGKRLLNLRKQLKEERHCIFSEPQFTNKQVLRLKKDFNLHTGDLDPIGADLKPGPELYFQLIDNLAQWYESCFLSK